MRTGVYRHYKGGYYQVMGVATDSTNTMPPGREMVVYIGLTEKPGNRMHVRERKEFEDFIWNENMSGGVERFRYIGQEIPSDNVPSHQS